MLTPLTPDIPKVRNNQPPTTAPMMPRMMSRNTPSPRLLTILLAMNPAIRPRTIQASTDMTVSRVELQSLDGYPQARNAPVPPTDRIIFYVTAVATSRAVVASISPEVVE